MGSERPDSSPASPEQSSGSDSAWARGAGQVSFASCIGEPEQKKLAGPSPTPLPGQVRLPTLLGILAGIPSLSHFP